MKQLLLIIIVFQFCSIAIAQELTINGRITNLNGDPVIGATILVENKTGSVSNENGYFIMSFLNNQPSYRLSVRSIGYETLDTLLSETQINSFLKLKLKVKIYEQETVQITAEKENVLDNKSWVIIDYTIFQNQLIVLYQSNNNRKIGVFDLIGNQIDEIIIEERVTELDISCTETLFGLSRKECLEFYLDSNKINGLARHNRAAYEKLAQPCIASINDELIFRAFSIHNKRAAYYKYESPQKPILLASIIDEDAARVSHSYYCEILGNYHTITSNNANLSPGENFAELNYIEDGLWDGNLLKLAVNSDMFTLITNYINLETKPVNVDQYVLQDRLYIMDYVNRNLLEVNTDKVSIQAHTVHNFDWHKKSKIYKDLVRDEVYILFKNKELSKLHYISDNYQVDYLQAIEMKGQFPEKIMIHNGIMFYISNYMNGGRKINRLEIKHL